MSPFQRTILSPERFLRRVGEAFRRAFSAEREQLVPCAWHKRNSPWHAAAEDDSLEYETIIFLFALVLLLKPLRIVQSEGQSGRSTLALASGCHANGFGSVLVSVSEEDDVKPIQELCHGLDVEVIHGPPYYLVPAIRQCNLFVTLGFEQQDVPETLFLRDGAFCVLANTGILPGHHRRAASFERSILFPTSTGLALFQKQDPDVFTEGFKEYAGFEELLVAVAKNGDSKAEEE